MTTGVLSETDKSTLKQQITAAIAAHHAWMGRLKTAAEYGRSSVDVETTAKEDVCPIGIWLTRDISPGLKARPLYTRTRTLHAQFHREASRTLNLALSRDPRAKSELAEGGAFMHVANELRRTLYDWLSEIG
ncbi:MAG TPA: CZB domain-containing protein [Candidatus Elarobacter sp.]|nr:CZB domain-containing protein [Candidatus Elarobacter sp.]